MSCCSNTSSQSSLSRPVKISDADLLADLLAVSRRLGRKKLSVNDYETFGRYCFRTQMKRFDSWTKALAKVGLRPAHHRGGSAEDLLRDLKRVAGLADSLKLTAATYRARGRYDIKLAYRHFGKWQHALAAAGLVPGCHRAAVELGAEQRARGPRTVNTTLRYRVLVRDCFRCVVCGRSPANEMGVKLEVDHILAWSNGGATVMENLQTLCERCNRGKASA